MKSAPKGILFITGTVGSGKTTVATEVGDQLANKGLPCAVIDLDWLGWVHVGDDFHDYDGLIIQNLISIWDNYRAVGVEYLILARMLFHAAPINTLKNAYPETPLALVRLHASKAALEERLASRDIGGTLREHLDEIDVMTEALDRLPLEYTTIVNEGSSIEETSRQIINILKWA